MYNDRKMGHMIITAIRTFACFNNPASWSPFRSCTSNIANYPPTTAGKLTTWRRALACRLETSQHSLHTNQADPILRCRRQTLDLQGKSITGSSSTRGSHLSYQKHVASLMSVMSDGAINRKHFNNYCRRYGVTRGTGPT